MYDEYFQFYQHYTQQYGPKTAIFLMVGSFYELYDIQDNETGQTRANVREITDLLGIQLSVKKADIDKQKDGLFAGFPDYVMHKWAGRLTSSGWTVVIVDQIKDSRGKVKERKVSRILSPSTHLENMPSTEIPYVTTLFLEGTLHAPPHFGAAALDLTTGTTHTYTGAAKGRTDLWTADDLIQFLTVYPPKELLVFWKSPFPLPEESILRRIFGISLGIPIHKRSVETMGAFEKDLVRNEYLQRIYAIRSLLPPITYLGLRTPVEEMSLLYLLQFVEEHYSSMLKSFHQNRPWIPDSRLICGNHALTQLQVTGPTLHETVMGLFDKAITVMGRRAMKERLLSPYSDPATIQQRLNEVSECQAWPEETKKAVERQLRFMFDLPRLHRKMVCGQLASADLTQLFQTYRAMEPLRALLPPSSHLIPPFSPEEEEAYKAVLRTHFSEDKARQASEDLTPFQPDRYPDIGKKEQELKEHHLQLLTLRQQLATAARLPEDAIRMEPREKEPFGFKVSSITLQQLKKAPQGLPEGIKWTELKSGGWVDCHALQRINTQIQKDRELLSHLAQKHLPDACVAISEAGSALWPIMEAWICLVDTTQCIASVSLERGFSCPTILPKEEGSSVLLEKVRHPLVEQSSSRVQYVTHDVCLTDKTRGWLVYGMNASGKSTLMKATGICILLAQAGCFVPATRMILSPFKALYTRILNQDNLFAGLSSFAVEMSELRDILRNADPYTMVLGDELCAGTESISAQALVAAGIQWLSTKHSSFIFATHLHDLPRLIDLEALRVQVWHLHVEYDPVTKKLIYDRSLRPGSGSTLYGLEVARAMDLPFEFIEQALQNRHAILHSSTQQEARSSVWNPEVVKWACEVCQSPIQTELEVHHLAHRSSATNQRLPNGQPMNHKQNLMVLCRICHDKLHADQITVGPLQMTSNGPERIITEYAADGYEEKGQEEAPRQGIRKGKWSEEEQETIKTTLQRYSSLSLKTIRAKLFADHEITISDTVLGRMRRELL